ncbi:5-methyltetrahydrofolate--homocysteine methyltransferase [Shewanella sp. YIC-542]|uniref:5-methyltetrahydrofolate--homocysteine methyltransferase n=1 Tax=Shewanella mytili TaxID=3377111 RepID=UPI00398ECA50
MTTMKMSYMAGLVSMLMLTGCGDAKTTIVEQPAIEAADEHDHDDAQVAGGRLSVLAADSNQVAVFDIAKASLLDTFSLSYGGGALSASAGARYAVITHKDNGLIEFVDGGLWQEDHVDHAHDYSEAPALSSFNLSGTSPAHLVAHDGQLAVFFDGNAASAVPAKVQVLTDTDIAAARRDIPTLDYTINMHGVAEPRGDALLATVRRDDVESESANPVLPDTVGVFHAHDGAYELTQTLDVRCPDLHGAAQNEDHVIFGCSDGVLLAHQHDDHFHAEKIANLAALGERRVGALYAHHDSDDIFGVASQKGSNAMLVAISAAHETMELVDWQGQDGANPLAYGFSSSGERFMVLDDHGYLSVLTAHEHDDHHHWEMTQRIAITEQDLGAMPAGLSFSMAIAQDGEYVYISDPIAQHVLQVDIVHGSIVSDIELDFVPAAVSWLGVPVEHDDEASHSH